MQDYFVFQSTFLNTLLSGDQVIDTRLYMTINFINSFFLRKSYCLSAICEFLEDRIRLDDLVLAKTSTDNGNQRMSIGHILYKRESFHFVPIRLVIPLIVMEGTGISDEVCMKDALENGIPKSSMENKLQGPEDYILNGTLRRPHMEWWRAVFLVLGDILGTGILAIPSGLASMGWLLGVLFLVVMCGIFIYCGLLLYKMRLMYPHIRTYGDLGREVYGKWGEWAVYLVQYTSLFLVLPVYLLVASTALRDTVAPNSCLIIWMFVNSGILLVFMQTRTLRFNAWYSLFGTLAIVVTLVIAIVQIIIDASSSTTHGQLVRSTGFENGLVGSGDIIFAYSGR